MKDIAEDTLRSFPSLRMTDARSKMGKVRKLKNGYVCEDKGVARMGTCKVWILQGL